MGVDYHAERKCGNAAEKCECSGGVQHRVPLAVCGEMAGEPLAALALIGIGLRSLSMAPGRIGPVKAMIRSVDLGSLDGLLADLDSLPSRSLRGKLRDFARDHGVAA